MKVPFSIFLCLQQLQVPFQVTTAFSSTSSSTLHSGGSQQVSFDRTLLRLQDSITSIGIEGTGTGTGTGISTDDVDADVDVDAAEKSSGNIRPIHQNWWPVSTVEALATDRPNAVQLLGMDLVLFQNDSNGDSDSDSGRDSGSDSGSDSGEWTCLEDRCSHRFAPLSEGRVVSSSNSNSNSNDSDSDGSNGGCSTKKQLECAYHGWRFDDDGSCNRIPQLEAPRQTKVRPYCSVQSYPVRIDSGLVFVWADPETAALGNLLPLPTFPALQKSMEMKGPGSCYMRDLPYGYELLGENLLDLSHLPFSHHSVGSLNRDLGGPLPFRMLSSNEKSPDGPLYEASLENAYKTDPQFKSNPKTPEDATLNLGFYEPCHVRYTRTTATTSYVALYFCPTSASRSRVFLFNLFGVTSDVVNGVDKDKDEDTIKPSKLQRMKNAISPASIKARVMKKMFSLLFTPVVAHQVIHKIFDGDGIFLRMQGDRMQKDNLTYKDYRTPAAADILVNSFRRYAKTATELARKVGKEGMAEVAVSDSGYGIDLKREDMLDRYESHTKNCKICSDALRAKEVKRGRIQVAKGIVRGGIGASASTLLAVAVLLRSSPEVSVPSAAVKAAGKILLGSVLASLGLSKLDEKNEVAIQQFLFEDYVHADKN